jgi:hypothetical protein
MSAISTHGLALTDQLKYEAVERSSYYHSLVQHIRNHIFCGSPKVVEINEVTNDIVGHVEVLVVTKVSATLYDEVDSTLIVLTKHRYSGRLTSILGRIFIPK